jgi:site-specific DNA recombinase
MWDLMLTGFYTPPEILETVNGEWAFRTRSSRKRGRKPLARSSIYRIFTRPFYYGQFEFPAGSGRWYRGIHEPMITEDEYDRVQMILGRKGNPRPRAHSVFPFTGIIRCGECGAMVTAEEKHQLICGTCRFKFAYRRRANCPHCNTQIAKMTKPVFLRYTYYHCTKSKNPSCSQGAISGAELEGQIGEYLSRIQISERFRTWAITYLGELDEQESASRDAVIQSQRKAHEDGLRRLDNLVRLQTAPENVDRSLLSDEEYSRQRMALLKERRQLEESLQNAGSRVEHWLDLSTATFDFACTARERFARGDPKTKKEILLALGSNLTLKGKNLNIVAKTPFLILAESLTPAEHQKAPIEPENTPTIQGPKGETGITRPLQRGLRDDVRTYGAKAERMVALIYAHFQKEFDLSAKLNIISKKAPVSQRP